MYDVYNPKVYSEFLKSLRKKEKLSLDQLSKILPFSPASLSLFENSENILCNDKLPDVLKHFNKPQNYLIDFDNKISELFHMYVYNILYLNEEQATILKKELQIFLAEQEGTILYSLYYLIDLIDKTFTDNKLEEISIDSLLNCIDYFTPKYKSLAYSYLGTNLVARKRFVLAKQYFDEAAFYISKDNTYEDIYYYFIASYYIYLNDIPNSITSCERAISLFTKSQNFKRLSNTNIIIANQYLKFKDYKKAMQVNKNVLTIAKQQNHLINQRISLNNIAFIHMMQANFEDAVLCFNEIPKETLKDRHYYSYIICLGETENFELGKQICEIGLSVTKTPYYRYIFKIYREYFQDGNLKKLTRNIEKVFNQYDDFLDVFENEFLCVLLGNQYKRLGNTKKALEYFEKLHQLNYSY